ncbi:uncharacterized protein LOC111254802 isoform X1 [Varroa destructor]|uniref:Uncharacterized protein n=1 Tax=Varroa destructor TaxID=109461 RepID=A0A7M7L6V9_VARDE|nr:uncharacterized protein LOC111254802 isoform X1 [Varroa destructor]
MGNEVATFLQEIETLWDFLYCKWLQLVTFFGDSRVRDSASQLLVKDDCPSDQPRRESLIAWWKATGQRPKLDIEHDPQSSPVTAAEPILKTECSERSSCKEKGTRDSNEVSFEAKRVSAPTPKEEEDPEPLLADMFDNIFSRRASFKVKAEIAERELYQKQLKMLSELTHKTELTDEDKKKLEYIDDNRRAYLSMDPRKTKRADSVGSDAFDVDDIFSRRGSFKIKAVECEEEIRRHFEAAAAGASDLSTELLCAMRAMKQDEQITASKPSDISVPNAPRCTGCEFKTSRDDREVVAVVEVFKKVDGAIWRLKREVETLRTLEGKTLEEVCPGLNDVLDQFIKEILSFKEAKTKKNTKAAQDSDKGQNDVKQGAKPKKEISFSLTSLLETTLGEQTQDGTKTGFKKIKATEVQGKLGIGVWFDGPKTDLTYAVPSVPALESTARTSTNLEPAKSRPAALVMSDVKLSNAELTLSKFAVEESKVIEDNRSKTVSNRNGGKPASIKFARSDVVKLASRIPTAPKIKTAKSSFINLSEKKSISPQTKAPRPSAVYLNDRKASATTRWAITPGFVCPNDRKPTNPLMIPTPTVVKAGTTELPKIPRSRFVNLEDSRLVAGLKTGGPETDIATDVQNAFATAAQNVEVLRLFSSGHSPNADASKALSVGTARADALMRISGGSTSALLDDEATKVVASKNNAPKITASKVRASAAIVPEPKVVHDVTQETDVPNIMASNMDISKVADSKSSVLNDQNNIRGGGLAACPSRVSTCETDLSKNYASKDKTLFQCPEEYIFFE